MSTPTAKAYLKFVVTPNLGEPADVERFSAARNAPRVQRMRTWGGEVDTFRHTGMCICCGRSTFISDLGNHDPRGPMGDHANQILDPHEDTGDEWAGPPVNLCALCANEETTYKAAIRLASALVWKRA